MSDTPGTPITPAPAAANDYSTMVAVIRQLLAKLQTMTLVKVMGVTNTGDVSAVGFVDVQPMVNQLTGDRQPVAHGTVYHVPYLRLQGGANAIILDPQVGDIGICGFCSRDISAVKENKDVSNPGSMRQFDWADGLYMGGVLNGSPEQYVQFNEDGITVVSSTEIKLQAPTVAIQGDLTVSGTTTGTGDGVFAGIDVATHTHPGVTSGGSNTGPPV